MQHKLPGLFEKLVRNSSLIYRIPGATWQLRLPAAAIEFLSAQAQIKMGAKESVGQLFSRDLTGAVVQVDLVTELPSRWASQIGGRLDMSAVQKERRSRFQEGLHCIGFWHSHPEGVPGYSGEDLEMARDHARAGAPIYAAIVFVIVGTEPVPRGLGIWVHDGETMMQATLESELAAFAPPPSALSK